MIARASRLPLLAHCGWWSRPDVHEPAQRGEGRGTSYQERGTAVHGAIESALRGVPGDGLDAEQAGMFAAWQGWWETQGLRPVSIEERHELDLATGTVRVVPAYDHTRTGVVVGTPDLIARSADGGIVVLDWKTGDDWQGYTAPASENVQLRTYALFAAARFDVATVRVIVVRLTSDGVETDAHDLDVLDLDAHLGWLRSRVGCALAEPKPGMHCGRCDAASVCPATLASGYELTRPGVRLEITADNAGRALERLEAIENACAQVREALRVFARTAGGIEISDGRVWAARVQVRETIDADAPGVAEALESEGVGAALKVKRSVSWTDAERIAREANGGRLPRGWRERMKERLGAMGALKTAEVEQFAAAPRRRGDAQ